MRFTHTNKRAPKVQQVASTDKTRPEFLHKPHLDAALAELQATNTTIAVRIPVDLEKGEASGPVDPALLDQARKDKAESVKVPKPPKAKRGETVFPNLAELWPSDAEADVPAFRVGINAAELKKLADAIGSDQLELRFPAFAKSKGPQNLRPILVRTAGDPAVARAGVKGAVTVAEGLIMPIRLRAEKHEATASKSSATSSSGSADRSAAARKAVETRRANAAAAAKGGTKTAAKKAAAGNGNGKGGKPSVAAAIKAAGSKKKQPRTTRKPSSNGNGADRGKGSDARRAAALKAAATRRANLAAAAK